MTRCFVALNYFKQEAKEKGLLNMLQPAITKANMMLDEEDQDETWQNNDETSLFKLCASAPDITVWLNNIWVQYGRALSIVEMFAGHQKYIHGDVKSPVMQISIADVKAYSVFKELGVIDSFEIDLLSDATESPSTRLPR